MVDTETGRQAERNRRCSGFCDVTHDRNSVSVQSLRTVPHAEQGSFALQKNDVNALRSAETSHYNQRKSGQLDPLWNAGTAKAAALEVSCSEPCRIAQSALASANGRSGRLLEAQWRRQLCIEDWLQAI